MQNSNGIPFNFYDHIAVLFPGAILLTYFLFITNWVFPDLLDYIYMLNSFSSAFSILMFIVLSFIFGHIAYSISKWSFEFGFNKKPVDKFLDFSSIKQVAIIDEVEKIYGNLIGEELRSNLLRYKNKEINGSQFGLKNYCYALVERKETKHDMFVALADFLRSTSFLLIIPGVFIVIKSLLDFFVLKDINLINFVQFLFFSVLPIAASHLLYRRSIRMRKAADSIIYSQFLFDAKNNFKSN